MSTPQTISWNRASTFKGFCGNHDNATFRSIENNPFTATAEQGFIVGYRALCFEVYSKRFGRHFAETTRNLIDRGQPYAEQVQSQHKLSEVLLSLCQGLSEMEQLKSVMDNDLICQRFDDWASVAIFFRGDLSIASSGVLSATNTITGEPLYDIGDFEAKPDVLLCGILAVDDGGAVVFTWKKDQTASEKLVGSLLSIAKAKLPGILVSFMFENIENLYFSEQWWTGLDESARSHIRSCAAPFAGIDIKGNRSETVSDKGNTLVPWKICKIEQMNCSISM